jgi:hypothetical protein
LSDVCGLECDVDAPDCPSGFECATFLLGGVEYGDYCLVLG